MSDTVRVSMPAVVVPRERLEDLMCNALEGGITYWAERVEIIGDWPKDCEWAHEAIARGCAFKVYHNEDECDTVIDHACNLLPKALGKLAVEFPHQWSLFLEEQDDAETADIVFQLYVFGEVVYG